MHIIFIHTPMPHRTVPERGRYWANFDERYYDFHPYARPLKKYLWELPHWVTWLGGVLYDQGFRSMEALDFYTDCGIVDGIDTEQIYNTLKAHPGDVYLFSPMTPNLPQALQIAEMVKELNPNSTTIFGGVVATPMHEEVAQEAGVGQATVYRHFGSKEGLIGAFTETYSPRQFVRDLVAQESGNLEQELTVFATDTLRFLYQNRDMVRLTFMGGEETQRLLGQVHHPSERAMITLARYFEQQIELGRLQAQSPAEMAIAFMGMLMSFGFIAPLAYGQTIDDPEEAARFVVRLFLDGMRGESKD